MGGQAGRHNRDQVGLRYQKWQGQEVRAHGLQAAAQPMPGQDVIDQSAAFGAIEHGRVSRRCKLAQGETLAQEGISTAHAFGEASVVARPVAMAPMNLRRESIIFRNSA